MENVFDISQSINGDQVIGFTSSRAMRTKGWVDYSTVNAYLMGDDEASHTKHLGMIDLFATTHNMAMPFMADMFANSAVLECNEGERITYDLPVNRGKSKCVTMKDTSDLYETPGVDETYFEIVLNRQFAKGDILTYDPQFGQQMIVSQEHEVQRDGENFRHFVQFSSNDRSKYFPKDQLKTGISYMKVGHVTPEYGTTLSTISMIHNPTGSITNEFLLGSPRGVESFMTARAARMDVPGLNAVAEDTRDSLMDGLRRLGGKSREMFFMASADGKGGMYKDTIKVGATLEYLGLLELQMMEAYSLLFARAATVNSSAGVSRVNEGVWWQYRRGKIIKYPKPGGITKDHIHEAASYIFKNSKVNPKNRVLRFKAGWFAYQNVLRMFSAEAIAQLGALPQGALGTDAQIPKVFSGNLDELKMAAVAIKSVPFPGIGYVEVEHDDSLDYQPLADRHNQGFFGEGEAHTAHSLVIMDATRPEYSNVSQKVKGAELVKNGSQMANVYYVKTEGANVTYGYTQGRMADGGNTSNVLSSLKYMGKEFWAYNQSAALVLDTTRVIIIELQHPEG